MRILTVHGAKRLEAPIVWLLGAHFAEKKAEGYSVLVDWEPEAPAPLHFCLYGNKDDRGTSRALLFSNEEELAARENLNLLYVAMTRARQVVFVSGVKSKKGGDESWYRLIADAVEAAEVKGVELAHDGATKPASKRPSPPVDVDPALRRPLDVGQRTDNLVDPRRRHGVLLHALLERLAPPAGITERDLLRETLAVSEEEFGKLWKETHAILSEPDLQRFFDPKRYLRAHNELAYVAESGELRRIDRLVEFDDAVWVLDYKTADAVDPEDLAAAARPYRDQLAEYRAAVGGLFPGKPVKSALVFGGGLLHVTDSRTGQESRDCRCIGGSPGFACLGYAKGAQQTCSRGGSMIAWLHADHCTQGAARFLGKASASRSAPSCMARDSESRALAEPSRREGGLSICEFSERESGGVQH